MPDVNIMYQRQQKQIMCIKDIMCSEAPIPCCGDVAITKHAKKMKYHGYGR